MFQDALTDWSAAMESEHHPPERTGAYTPAEEAIGTVVAGRYKLLEQIGEGGMGTVWVAEQTQPVRRKVALKLVKAGMDSKAVLSRFEQERQALALMDHPNIARILDAGTTESGRPFFAMEYVKGIPLTRYCDEARLTVRERLALFVPVCQAVQHAHQKGIIHRDLKPSNILVCLYDGVAVPKVIDFGLAKAMHQPLTEHTVYTAHGVTMGTPLYMSPEQAEVNNLDVDTRTDVYSLGVILYELLTGTTPLERKRFKEGAWQEVLRLIKEEEPPRPSTRLSGSATLPTIAAQRKLGPAKLSRLVRGELDWIVMKALEKERSRRYDTVNGLARDVQRYLADEVVEARPPSTGYRLRKFARKHRALLTTAAVIAVLLVGGIVGTTLGLIRARAAEQDAVRAQTAEAEQRLLAEANVRKALAAAAAEKKAKEEAEARKAETDDVLAFIEWMFEGPGETTIRRAVEAVLPDIGNSYFKGQPLMEARVRLTLGVFFINWSEAEKAREQFQRAYDLRKTHLGPVDPVTLSTIENLAYSYMALGQRDQAIKVREEALALCRTELGPDALVTLECMRNLALGHEAQRQYAKFLELSEDTLARCKANLEPHHPLTLRSMGAVARGHAHLGRHEKAVELFKETLALRKAVLGPTARETLLSMGGLARSLYALNRHADGVKLLEEAIPLWQATSGKASVRITATRPSDRGEFSEDVHVSYGSDSRITLRFMFDLALGYDALGRHADALELHEETLKLRSHVLGDKATDTLGSLNQVAWTLATSPDARLRDATRAVELATQAVAGAPKNHSYRNTLGAARYRAGDWKGAIADLEQAIALRQPDSHFNAFDGFFLAMAHWQLGEKDQARTWFDKAIAWMDRGLKDNAGLQRFRAEAAALLDVPVAPPTPAPDAGKGTDKQ
jgi:tetratricopeptide (TPR) repeat protein